ncbi:VanZ family protein [Ketobacter sp.]|uniref:VanZ family protein n=1 Tax=Ketobacter sp. TaxID=2083498 RepID=UPI000F2A1851|nr:VanZ family protein [Ketobacter sp.]RLU00726.1 MAG: VanZ family protein [Ketobacter sp.]
MIQAILFLCVVAAMCVAGFWPPNAEHYRAPYWSAAEQGLVFNGHSQAYTERFFAPDPEASAVTIEMAIKPQFQPPIRYRVLLHIYDLENDTQIVVGQWRQRLMVLQSEDYSNRQRLPKIYADLDSNQHLNRIRLESGPQGTRVYVNDQLQGSNRHLVLTLPAHPARSHLILGSDASASYPWMGSIQSLALHAHRPDTPASSGTGLQYRFSAQDTEQVADASDHGIALLLPATPVILKKKLLQLPTRRDLTTRWLWRDSLINFFGFIPFGLLLSRMLLARQQPRNPLTHSGRWQSIILPSTLAAFLFSLSIEITQITIPERTSYLLDLILNTAGGFTGALVAWYLPRWRRS